MGYAIINGVSHFLEYRIALAQAAGPEPGSVIRNKTSERMKNEICKDSGGSSVFAHGHIWNKVNSQQI